jgi:hypothetical protein
MALQKMMLVSCGVTAVSAGVAHEQGHGHWHGTPGAEDAVYHEHDHGSMMNNPNVDPTYELTNKEFLEMDAETFWNVALPKLDPSKLENLIQTLDPDHLQRMLSEMQMPGGHPDDHLEKEDFDDEIPSADIEQMEAETVEETGEGNMHDGEL